MSAYKTVFFSCFLFLLFSGGKGFAADRPSSFYTVQVSSGSEQALDSLIGIAEKLERDGFPRARVERIGRMYSVRAGAFEKREGAAALHEKIKGRFPGSFIRKGYYLPERIVYPVSERPEAPVTAAPEETTEEVLQHETGIVSEPPDTFQPGAAVEEREEPAGKRGFPFPVVATFLLFFILVALPFFPGMMELRKPRDSAPLFINMHYIKDPKYLAASFKNLLVKALEKTGLEPGMKEVNLSKKEKVEVAVSKNISDGEKVEHIIYAGEDFKTGKDVTLEKEIYAVKSAVIGENNVLRAIACDGNLLISSGTGISRWISSGGEMKIASGCSAGNLCSCSGKLEINRDSSFKALYGLPVYTYGIKGGLDGKDFPGESLKTDTKPAYNEISAIDDVAMYFRGRELTIPPNSLVERDIIAKTNMVLRKGCRISGNIKVYGDIFLEEDNVVDGNIFAEGSIFVGENCRVTGTLFSQNIIRFEKNVRVGRKDKVKSVIGKKGVEMTENNVVYGYILTEGRGRIL